MFDVILACTKKFGIGYKGSLPWKNSAELKIFKEKTTNSVLIIGRKTLETLPSLPNRNIICLSKNTKEINNHVITDSLQSALKLTRTYENKKIFIAGGSQIYNECFNFPDLIDRMHISIMEEEYECDTFINLNLSNWIIESEQKYENFTHYVMKYDKTGEFDYLNLLKDVLYNSKLKKGRNGNTKSTFVKHLSFNLQDGFPLLTTKKMFFRGIVEEFLFFLRGETDSKILEEKGINIWKGNTSREFLNNLGMLNRKEGMMGPMYGYQWRYYGAKYDEETGKNVDSGIDQILNIIKIIKEDPNSRRILLSTFNPLQAEQGVLYPCHTIIAQFYVEEENDIKYLNMYCYNRSQDLFLGTPFNIASSALLLSVISKLTNTVPKYLYMSLGDAHIYEEHFEHVKLQLERQRYKFPILKIRCEANLSEFTVDDFVLDNYSSHSPIKAKMII